MLNCIAICRYLDKKPGGNIMESSIVSKLLGGSQKNIRGGVFMNPNSIEIAGGEKTRKVQRIGSENDDFNNLPTNTRHPDSYL